MDERANPFPMTGAGGSPGALLIAEPARADLAERLISASGARLLGTVSPAQARARVADQIDLGLILLDTVGAAPDAAEGAAWAVADWVAERACRIVATIDPAAIDSVATPLLAAGATLLCDAAPGELAAALARATMPPTARLHDGTREREVERLRLLNEEVARLATVLAELSREDAGAVRETGTGYRAEVTDVSDPEPQAVRAAIRVRRLRDQYFAADLFADPAWDMLLDLYAARIEGRRVSVSSLCIAAAVPPTTALRWIGTMHDAGLFGREPDPTDKRRAHITLTARAAAAMRGYFAAIDRAGLSAA
ncbi:winged helix DNA-binding protein [Sphingomonas sp.]|uniref:winged helix DNA-binding protein n=1 Tax=Sphingomonas sp. TaxID=28214 RepID=UPI001EC9CC13|nr:winged helix DNA-binding protein [Sphingomonas sp.]MBX3595798.1 winged helix DNA-binding protein [Sphingomonas sp.]